MWSVLFLIKLLALAGSSVLAARNVRAGRGDRKGATRVALVLFAALLLAWISVANHSSILGAELAALRARLATALYFSVQAAVYYLAIEPYFRRLWPRQLVSWVRLLEGRFRDRLVGRDVLLGALLGGFLAATFVGYVVARSQLEPSGEPPIRGVPDQAPGLGSVLLTLSNPSYEIGLFMGRLQEAVNLTFLAAGALVLMRLLLRTPVAAVGGLYVLGLFYDTVRLGAGWSSFVTSLAITALTLAFFLRVGILGTIAYHLVFFTLTSAALTLDPNAWYTARSWITLLIVLSIGVWGFLVATAGRPLFPDVLSRP